MLAKRNLNLLCVSPNTQYFSSFSSYFLNSCFEVILYVHFGSWMVAEVCLKWMKTKVVHPTMNISCHFLILVLFWNPNDCMSFLLNKKLWKKNIFYIMKVNRDSVLSITNTLPNISCDSFGLETTLWWVNDGTFVNVWGKIFLKEMKILVLLLFCWFCTVCRSECLDFIVLRVFTGNVNSTEHF